MATPMTHEPSICDARVYGRRAVALLLKGHELGHLGLELMQDGSHRNRVVGDGIAFADGTDELAHSKGIHTYLDARNLVLEQIEQDWVRQLATRGFEGVDKLELGFNQHLAALWLFQRAAKRLEAQGDFHQLPELLCIQVELAILA